MDEEQNNKQQTQAPAPLSDARKAALLRYMAILFAVAFVLVLLSLILQTHSSKSTISELSAASTSALDNAVKLQEENRALQEEQQQLASLQQQGAAGADGGVQQQQQQRQQQDQGGMAQRRQVPCAAGLQLPPQPAPCLRCGLSLSAVWTWPRPRSAGPWRRCA